MKFSFKAILIIIGTAGCLGLTGVAAAQQPAQIPAQIPALPQSQSAAQNALDSIRPTYSLGPNDQILIHAPEAEEINDKPFRVDDDGTVTLPLVGVVKAAGMTLQQFEDDLKVRLKTYIRNPVISVTVVQFRSSPVFFIGEFIRPGIYPLQGRHTLVEMLMGVGGLQTAASRRIKVTRKSESGLIPLPGVVEDSDAKTNSVEISMVTLSQSINPAEDIELQPYDVISVEKAEQVYTQGAVGKIGGTEVGARDSISMLQLLSLSGGLAQDADASKARILRPVLNTTRRAGIPVDLNKILATEGTDYPLLPNDVLYVPRKKTFSPVITKLGTVAVTLIPSILIGLLINGRL